MGAMTLATVLLFGAIALISVGTLVLFPPSNRIVSLVVCLILCASVSTVKGALNKKFVFTTYTADNEEVSVKIDDYIAEDDYIFVSELGFVSILSISEFEIVAEKSADVTHNLQGRVALSQDLRCPVGYVDRVSENKVYIKKYIVQERGLF